MICQTLFGVVFRYLFLFIYYRQHKRQLYMPTYVNALNYQNMFSIIINVDFY